MRKSDIQSLGDIARLILEGTADAENLNNTANHLYDKLGQNLRLNDFMDGSKPIVMFYTMKISDTENDVLHNEAGPAIVFANERGEYDESDPELAFYFINDAKVDPNSPEWKAAHQKSAGQSMSSSGAISDEGRAATGGDDYDFDKM